MSTLKANTIQDASGGNSMSLADINQGRAKAWINFNGTGTIATRDSFGISSITDQGTGQYRVTYTVAQPNGNQSVTNGTALPGGNSGSNNVLFNNSTVHDLVTAYFNTAAVLADSATVCSGVFGD